MERNDYKCRLARSTLSLIPLLGIHYVFFAFVDDQHLLNNGTKFVYVKIAFETIFTSFQVLIRNKFKALLLDIIKYKYEF